MEKKTLSPAEAWILKGIAGLFVIGSAMHFAFAALGRSPLVGIFAPVNESVWEHTKLIVWPTILWWGLYLRFGRDRAEVDRGRWVSAMLVAVLTAIAVMFGTFYFYTGAFGVELLWVDILLLLVSVAAGQGLGLHLYRRGRGIGQRAAWVAALLLVVLFAVVTFFPPKIPLFLDAPTGTYGIWPQL